MKEYITVRKLTKKFNNQVILNNINFSINKGDFITILGPSGCGKTTLLRILAGLENKDAGEIFIDNKLSDNLSMQEKNIGMIFQNYSLFPHMSVYKNIEYGLKIKNFEKKKIYEKIKDIMALMNISELKNKYPFQLSGGQRQRVAIARTLVVNPRIVLMDEPFSAIDAKLRNELQIGIRNIHKKLGITTIFVTHDQTEALKISDKIMILNKGKIEQYDTPFKIYNSPESLFVSSFIGNYNILTPSEYRKVFEDYSLSKNIYILIKASNIYIDKKLLNTPNYYKFKYIIRDMFYLGDKITLIGNINSIDIKIEICSQYYRKIKDYGNVMDVFIKKDDIIYKKVENNV